MTNVQMQLTNKFLSFIFANGAGSAHSILFNLSFYEIWAQTGLILLTEFVFAAHVIGQRDNAGTRHLTGNHTDAWSFAHRSEIGRVVLFLCQQRLLCQYFTAKKSILNQFIRHMNQFGIPLTLISRPLSGNAREFPLWICHQCR